MTESTKPSLLTPEAALAVARELFPPKLLPEHGTGFLKRSKNGTGPKTVLDKGPGIPPTGRHMYKISELREWCLAQQPPAVRAAIEASDGAAAEAAGHIREVLSEMDPDDDWWVPLSRALEFMLPRKEWP